MAALFLAAVSPAMAANYAVLVGVSDYDDSIGLADLKGPANDVLLLQQALSARGAFEMTVLADGVDGGVRPTRQAILSALEAVAAAAGDGDFVYIHLSGHGTQQRDTDGDETDGLDEVFLPADTARAAPGTGVIPNAIRDEELGAAVAAIRAKGADVWFVLDSCHSGSGLRAAGPDIRTRFVDPETLGVDVSGITPAANDTGSVDSLGGDDLPGQFLAFYSAQSDEVAREVELDPDAPSGNGWFGLFSAKLAARLADDTAISYRQLFQAVLSDLNASDVPGAARLQTPLWDGPMIDATVLGGRETTGLRQFAVTRDEVSAGLLHGLKNESVVALVGDATAGLDEVLGYAQIESAAATKAYLAPVGTDCVAESGAPCVRRGTLPAEARFARLVAAPLDLTVVLSPPIDMETGIPLAAEHPLARALDRAVASVSETSRIEVSAKGADISVGAKNGRLWFGQSVAVGQTPVGVSWQPSDGPLEELLHRIYASEEIARMLASVGGGGSVLFGSPVEIGVTRNETTMSGRPQSVSGLGDIRDECLRALRTATRDTWTGGGDLNQCDQLYFEARGLIPGPARDVNRVHIDSEFCVHTSYQRIEGTALAALVGEPITVCADCPDDAGGVVQKAGFEQLFMVVTEAEANSEALDLRGLLENCSETGGATRSSGDARAAQFLTALGQRSATRGNLGGLGISNIWVEEFHWMVTPRREAIRRAGATLE